MKTPIRLTLGLAVLALLLCSVLGCSTLGYYWQSASGHVSLMNAARPLPDWIAEPGTPAALRQRLVLAQRIRAFAAQELALPDNASYQRYADLQRRAAVWNVVAAPVDSLELSTWCFWVVGCVSYRGYFSEADAQAQAATLARQGLEVSVLPVPAYSTLGWLDWAGGDPLLNTFIHYPEGELARLVFHELAHQVVYVRDDTAFNESFATAVERLGAARWLKTQAGEAARAEYALFDGRRRQLRALALATREELAEIYRAGRAGDAQTRADAPAHKAAAMQRFRDRYGALKTQWGGYSGYDAFVARANNASLGAQATYEDGVPGFEALFVRSGENWPQFYDAVKQLAQLPREQRQRALSQLAQLTQLAPHPAATRAATPVQ